MRFIATANLLLLGLVPLCARGAPDPCADKGCAACAADTNCRFCHLKVKNGADVLSTASGACVSGSDATACPTMDDPRLDGVRPLLRAVGFAAEYTAMGTADTAECGDIMLLTEENATCSKCLGTPGGTPNWCSLALTLKTGSILQSVGGTCLAADVCVQASFAESTQYKILPTETAATNDCPTCTGTSCVDCENGCNWCTPFAVGTKSAGEYREQLFENLGQCSDTCSTLTPGTLGDLFKKSAENNVDLNAVVNGITLATGETCGTSASATYWATSDTCEKCRETHADETSVVWCNITSATTYGEVAVSEVGGYCAPAAECVKPVGVDYEAANTGEGAAVPVTSTPTKEDVTDCTGKAAGLVRPSICVTVGVVVLAAAAFV